MILHLMGDIDMITAIPVIAILSLMGDRELIFIMRDSRLCNRLNFMFIFILHRFPLYN
jgi:hypothetical protein